MVREIKIGILAVVTLILMIWGYQFLKGKNLLSNIKTLHVVYSRVDQLDVAAPVMVNGYQVGSVSKIRLNPQDVKTIVVSMEVDGKIGYPDNAKAVLGQGSIVGGKIIMLEFDELCNGNNCLVENDTLVSMERGFVESLVGEENLENYIDGFQTGTSAILDTISDRLKNKDSDSPINQVLWNMNELLENLTGMTKTMNVLLSNSQRNLDSTFANLNTITGNLAKSNEEINTMLSNMSEITTQIKDADLSKTLIKSQEALDTATYVFSEMGATLNQASTSFEQLSDILDKMESGEGTLSKLLNDKEMYNNLETSTNNLALLLQDMRLNPKRYLSVSVFGRKGKEYTKPENDPAYEEEQKKLKN